MWRLTNWHLVLGHPGAQAMQPLLAAVGHHIGHAEVSRKVPPGEVAQSVNAQLFGLLAPAYALADSGEVEQARALYRLTGPPTQWTIPPSLRPVGACHRY